MNLICDGCGSLLEATVPPVLVCPKCGDFLTVTYDYEAVKEKVSRETMRSRAPGTWKYLELLPLGDAERIISLGEGETYLHKCVRLAETLGLKHLYVKNETLNPTGSFNDRGATVVASMANQSRLSSLHCASVGNLAVSLSAYTAKAGMRCAVFVPKEVDLGKLHQLIAYGAQIMLTDSIEQAVLESMKFKGSYGVAPSDPYFVEGEKTIGFDVCEQLGWRAPSFLVVPLGSGGNFHAIWKSLNELSKVGLITSVPTSMIGVQATLCAPIADAFKQQKGASGGKTIATEIAIANPQFMRRVLKTLHESKGLATAVSDPKILESIHLLAKYEGIFAEPSAAATIAGLRELIEDGKIDRTDEVVCVITGAGLKDPNIAARLVGEKQTVGSLVTSTERKFITKLGPTKIGVLRILSLRSLHGYGIWKELKSAYNIEIKPPVVYQHLRELEEISLIRKTRGRSPTPGREKVYYSITDKGRRFVRLWEKSTF